MPTTRPPVIRFHFLSKALQLRDRNALKVFLRGFFRQKKVTVESLQVIFCDDNYLLRINREFLRHETYTDIITFNLAPAEANSIEGEIYISLDRVRENARLHREPYYRELHRLIFHGALHLCGYDDKTPPLKKTMSLMEDGLLAAYFKR